MFRVARRSVAIFASAVVCVAGTNALKTTMISGGTVPSGGDALSSASVASPIGSPLAADVVAVSGAGAGAGAGVGIADGEKGLMGTAAAQASAVAAESVVNR